MISKDKFEKIFLFSVLITFSAALSIPLPMAFADNVHDSVADTTPLTIITRELPQTFTTRYYVTPSTNQGTNDPNGCNITQGTNSTVDIIISADPLGAVTVSRYPATLSRCQSGNGVDVTFSSTVAGVHQISAVMLDTDGYSYEMHTDFILEFIGDTIPPVITVPTSPVRVGGSNSDNTPQLVSYSVTATDNSGTAPSISCADDGSGATNLGATGGIFPIGLTTVNCTATDSFGNSASGSFVVLYGRTEIVTPVTPAAIKWDKTFTASVLTHGFESDDTIEIRRADNSAVIGSVTPLIGNTDSGATITVSGLTLPKTDSGNDVGIVAVLVDNPVIATSSTFLISVLPHVTSLSLEPMSDVVTDIPYAAKGALVDTDESGAGISDALITFTGSGVTPSLGSATTAGIKITGPGEITFCPSSSCLPNVGSVLAGVNVLHLKNGATMEFPSGSIGLTLFMQDMGINPFIVRITDVNDNSIDQTDSGADPYVKLFTPAVAGGIKKIEVLSSDSITGIGISNISIFDPDVQPENLMQANFDARAVPISIGAGVTIVERGGNYFSIGVAQSTEQQDLQVTAQYAASPAYTSAVSSTESYETQDSQLGVAGEGNLSVAPRQLAVFSTIICGAGDPDTDGDGICNTWDGTTSGKGVPYDVRWVGSTTTSRLVLGGSNELRKDAYVEIDNMLGHALNPTAVANVVSAFNKSAVTNPNGVTGIRLQVDFSTLIADTITHNTNLASATAFSAWADSDFNSLNDFDSVKALKFGLASQRPSIGGTPVFSLVDAATLAPKVRGTGFTITMPAEITDGTIFLKQRITLNSPLTTLSSLTVTPPAAPSNIAGTVEYRTPTASVSSSGTSRLVITTIPFSAASGATITLTNIDTTVNLPSGTITLPSPGGQVFVTTSKLNARAMVYHYGLSIHSVGLCGPSGVAEQKGNDFIISLGCDFTTAEPTTFYTEPTGTGHTASVGSVNEQAGTLMHELGHNFNLAHGGPKNLVETPTVLVADSSINCKPNYISVMSYPRQYDTGYLGTAWQLNYSRGLFTASGAPPLTESNLSEDFGLMSSNYMNPTIIFAIPQGSPPGSVTPSILATGITTPNLPSPIGSLLTNINFDGDGSPGESSVSININNFKIPGCDDGTAAPRTTPYNDYNDWVNLFYNFRASTTGTAQNGAGGSNYAPPGSVSEQTGKTAKIIANNADSFVGFGSPVNMDGSSSLKAGSATNPFKFKKTTGGENPVSDSSLVATLVMKPLDFPAAKCAIGKNLNPGIIKAGAINNIPFLYSAGSETYSANLQTKNYGVGIYSANIVLNKGTAQEVVLTSLDFPYAGGITVPVCITK